MAANRSAHRSVDPRHDGSPYGASDGTSEDLGRHLQQCRRHHPAGPAPCHRDGALRRLPLDEFRAAMAHLRRVLGRVDSGREDELRPVDSAEAHRRTTIWGGDWNQALEGRDYVGSSAGRKGILELVNDSRLSVPTTTLGSASRGHRAIDHIAIPISWDVTAVQRGKRPWQDDGCPITTPTWSRSIGGEMSAAFAHAPSLGMPAMRRYDAGGRPATTAIASLLVVGPSTFGSQSHELCGSLPTCAIHGGTRDWSSASGRGRGIRRSPRWAA